MNTNITTTKCASVWWQLYVLRIEAQFTKKLSKTEAELKKTVTYKKKCISVDITERKNSTTNMNLTKFKLLEAVFTLY